MEEKIIYKIEYEGADELQGKLKALSTETQKLEAQNKELLQVQKEGGTAAGDATKKLEQNTIKIQENRKKLTELHRAVKENSTQQIDLGEKLDKTRKELERMALAGDTSSKQYRKLRAEASQYQDIQDRVNAEIQTFADDQLAFNTALDSAQLLGAGMQALQGVTQLAGVENEKLVESIARLQSIMAITNSIQQASNLLQKESRVVILGKIAATKLATAAQAAWNAVLNANPIGLIVTAVAALTAGIVLLVKNFDDVTDTIKRAWNWMKFWKEDTDEAVIAEENLQIQLEETTRALDKRASALDFQIKLMKTQGKSQDEINEKQREALKLNIQLAKAESEKIMMSGEATQEELRAADERILAAERELVMFEESLKREIEEKRIAEAEKTRIEKMERAKRRAQREEMRADERKREEEAQLELQLLRNKTFENERALLKFRMEQELENDRLTKSEKLLIEEEYRIALEELRNKYGDDPDSGRGADDPEVEQLREKYAAMLEVERQNDMTQIERINEKYEQEQSLLSDFLENKIISEEEYNKRLSELEKKRVGEIKKWNTEQAKSDEELQNKRADAFLGGSSAIIDSFSQIAEESKALFIFQKAISVAQATVKVAEGLAASSSIGFPQNLVTIAGFIAQTAGLVNSIKNVNEPQKPQFNPKLRDGGIIQGPSHSTGGIKFKSDRGHAFEVEGGEFIAVVNKKDAQYAQQLNEINKQHGIDWGLGSTTPVFSRGGIFEPQLPPESPGTDEIVREVVSGITSIPVVVSETDITDTQRRVEVLESRGNL